MGLYPLSQINIVPQLNYKIMDNNQTNSVEILNQCSFLAYAKQQKLVEVEYGQTKAGHNCAIILTSTGMKSTLYISNNAVKLLNSVKDEEAKMNLLLHQTNYGEVVNPETGEAIPSILTGSGLKNSVKIRLNLDLD